MNKIVSSLVMLAITAVILHTSAGTANAADVRNAWWGMSRDEVKASEPPDLAPEVYDNIHLTVLMYGFKTSCGYAFDRFGRFTFAVFSLKNVTDKEKSDVLKKIKKDLSVEYGEAIDDNNQAVIFRNERTHVKVEAQKKDEIGIYYSPIASHENLPSTSGSGAPDVRNVRWGMRTYDVRNKEVSARGRNIENQIIFEDTVLGEKASLLYTFDSDKKLVALNYVFTELSQNSAQSLFDSLGSMLDKKYGSSEQNLPEQITNMLGEDKIDRALIEQITNMLREYTTDRTHITLTNFGDKILLSYEELAFHKKNDALIQERMDSVVKKRAADLQQF